MFNFQIFFNLVEPDLTQPEILLKAAQDAIIQKIIYYILRNNIILYTFCI